MDRAPDERRKDLRIYRNFILSYHEKGKSAVGHDVSQVNNVSRGGINFSSSRHIKQGSVVVVDLKTFFFTDSIILEGVVLECREKISEVIYEIRVQFQDVPPQVLTVLEKIENYSKDQEN